VEVVQAQRKTLEQLAGPVDLYEIQNRLGAANQMMQRIARETGLPFDAVQDGPVAKMRYDRANG